MTVTNPRPFIQAPGLDARYRAGRRYELVAPFRYYTDVRVPGDTHWCLWIEVPAGFVTDFSSTPRPLWWYVPPDDYAEAGVLHDYLYRTQHLPRVFADRVYREAYIHCGGRPSKAWIMYSVLRLFGWIAWRNNRRHLGHSSTDPSTKE